MPTLNLGEIQYGERVQHDLRVVDRIERQKSNGEPFVILTLGNTSGEIDTEPIWSNLLADGWVDGAHRGAVVQTIGHVVRYERAGAVKRQLKLTAPLRVLPRDALRVDEFLPRIAQDTARLWDSLDEMRHGISSSRLCRVLSLFFDDEPFRLRFERAPASIGGHHSAIGGLLLHVTEVAYIGRHMARAMRANSDLVVAGALLHDIGKLEAYDITWEGFVRTPCGHLVEHVVLGLLMLERRLAALGEPVCSTEQLLELQHLILSHHGQLEFGSPVRPLTLEAEILHRADDASAKATDVSDALADPVAFRDDDPFPADRSRLWRVDRRALWRRGHSWD
ncbi:MAG TPA: HD domain-containing protein [Gemmatimonadaceae bacterium]|nr:HD domain-containing protein [Gemmatimonadaceae bacterium]